jgi:hypothetical protein
LENFVLGVQEVADFLVSPQDALASVEVIQTAYEALQDSRWHAIGCSVNKSSRNPIEPPSRL